MVNQEHIKESTMTSFRRLIIVDCSEPLAMFKLEYGFNECLANDLIDLIIFSVWDALKANGIEWIHGDAGTRHYLSPEELIATNVHDMVDDCIKPDNEDVYNAFISAAINTYRNLPIMEYCMDAFTDIGAEHCTIHWRNTDVYIGLL